jgi:flagellar basal body rod protein FlgG
MVISNAAMRALEDIASRERDLLQAYAPGAIAERSDVAQHAGSTFALDPLSACAPADAYFIARDGRGRLLFTRDGVFSLRDGTLVDAQGHEVLGFPRDGATLSPLRADSVDVALGLTSSAAIQSDGAIGYDRSTVDPRTGAQRDERVIIGRLALARFAPATKLQSVDPQHVVAPAHIAPHIGVAGDGNFDAVQPFARENSGVDIDLGLQRLQDAYLALEAIQAAGKARSSVDKTAMDLLK